MSAPARPTWPFRIIAGLLILLLGMMIVSVALSTWRQLFPRPPAPMYVCVYVTEQGSTTITGSTPCPVQAARPEAGEVAR